MAATASSSSSSRSSSSSLFMAGSVLAVAGLGLLWSRNRSGAASREITEIDFEDGDNNDFLSAQEVAQIFDQLHLEMQQVFAQLMQQMQQLQMMAASGRGQMPSEAELRQIVTNELQRALHIKQAAVLQKFDVDYDCWEEATWEFLQDEDRHPDVARAVERFQKLWQTATGQRVQGWRPGKILQDEPTAPVLSPDETLKAAETYFQTFPTVMRSLMDEYKAQGLDLKEEKVQGKLNMEFSTRANEAGETALQEQHAVTMAQFEASIKAHAGNPAVGRRLAELQTQQQQEMMNLTVRP